MAQETAGKAISGKFTMDRATLNDKAALARLYEEMTLKEMATVLRCAKSTVRAHMIRHGIPRRRACARQAPSETVAELHARGKWRPTWEAATVRERIRISWFRLHVLGGLCPELCPDLGFCTGRPKDGRGGCVMYNRLSNLGELRPRPWEPEDPFTYWAERFRGARGVGHGLGD